MERPLSLGARATPDQNYMSTVPPSARGSLNIIEQDSKASYEGRRTDLKAFIETSPLEGTLFKLAYITCQDNELPPKISWVLLIIEDLQWLSFSFSVLLHKEMPVWLGIVFDPIRVVNTYPAFLIANILTLFLVFTIVTIVGVVIFIMQKQAKVPIFALQVLRFLSALVMTALSIPIASFLAMGVHCIDGNLPKFGVQCFSLPHLPLYIFNILGLIAFVPMVVVGIVLFIEISPTSKSPVARAHARIDVHDIVARIVLVFLDIALYKSSELYQWGFMSVSVVWLFFLSYKMSCTQPYYSSVTTAFRSGMTMATSSSMVASMVIRGLVGHNTMGNWIYLIPASIFGFLMGILMTYGYSHYFLRRTVSKWHRILQEERASANDELPASLAMPNNFSDMSQVQSQMQPNEVESAIPFSSIQCSPIKENADQMPSITPELSAPKIQNSPGNISALISAISLPTNNGPMSPYSSTLNKEYTPVYSPSFGRTTNLNTINRPTIGRPPQTLRSSVALSKDNPTNDVIVAFSGIKRSPSTTYGISNAKTELPTTNDSDKIVSGLANGTSGDVFNIVTEKDPPLRQCVFDSPLDVEVCIRFIRKNPSVKKITIGLQLLERGLLEFPNNPLLLLLASTYLTLYYGETGAKVATNLMKQIGKSKTSIPVDVKYFVFCREQAKTDEGVGVIDRVEMDSLQKDVRQNHMRALRAMREVWDAIRTKSSSEHLAVTITNVAKYRWSASAAYQKLLERNQKNKNTLRQYSMFLTTIEGDFVQARQMIALADEVDLNHMDEQGMSNARTISGINESFDVNKHAHTPPLLDLTAFQLPAMEVSPPKPQNAMGSCKTSVSGSERSGTSSSRVNCRREGLQLQLYERLTQPLKSAKAVSIIAILFISALIVGFVLCLILLSKTASLLQVDLYESRRSRAAMQSIIEGIRQMVYANEIQDPSEFNTAYLMVSSSFDYLMTVGLPVINSFNILSVSTKVREFQFLYGKITIDNMWDYQPILKTSVQFANDLAQIAALALNYQTYGTLTAAKFVQIPEFRMITDNLFAVQDATEGLISIAVDYYNSHAGELKSELLIVMLISLVLLGMLAIIIHRLILCPYFLQEEKVHTLLLSIRKSSAVELVTILEEDIENYSEFVKGEEEDYDLDMADNGTTGDSGEGESSRQSSGVRNTGETKKRQLLYYLSLHTVVVVSAAILVTLFINTITILDVQDDLIRMVESLNCRFYSNSLRMIGREYISPDQTLPIYTVLQYFRSSIYTAELAHKMLINDPNGITVIMPDITTLPRNCSVASNCGNLVEIPEIGFTRRLAEMSLILEYSRMLDTATRVCDSHNSSDPKTFSQWLLLKALTDDVNKRITIIDNTYANILQTRADATGQWIIVIFVILIIGSIVACIAFILIGIRRLMRDASVLITLLYALSPAMLKENPELKSFIETCGLILMNV